MFAHTSGYKVSIIVFWFTKKPCSELFSRFLSIYLDPVIKMFWIFTFKQSSTLSNTLWKLHIWGKSDFGCLLVTRPLFVRLNHFFHHILKVIHYGNSDTAVWTTENLDRMYSRYSYWKMQNYIFQIFTLRGINQHNQALFFPFLHLFTFSQKTFTVSLKLYMDLWNVTVQLAEEEVVSDMKNHA